MLSYLHGSLTASYDTFFSFLCPSNHAFLSALEAKDPIAKVVNDRPEVMTHKNVKLVSRKVDNI